MSDLTLTEVIGKLNAMRAKGIEVIGVATTPDSINIEELLALLIKTVIGDVPQVELAESGLKEPEVIPEPPNVFDESVLKEPEYIRDETEGSETPVSTGDGDGSVG